MNHTLRTVRNGVWNSMGGCNGARKGASHRYGMDGGRTTNEQTNERKKGNRNIKGLKGLKGVLFNKNYERPLQSYIYIYDGVIKEATSIDKGLEVVI